MLVFPIISKMRGSWIAVAALLVHSARATPTSTPTCVATYEVQVDDDCNSVAKAMNISTYYLLKANNLDLYCQTFANQVGKTLCIPFQCTTYTWGPYDTCDDVIAGFEGLTLLQFLAWNPNFSSLCVNSPLFLGYEICVGPPGSYLDHGSGNGLTPTMTSGSISVVAPTNAVKGSNLNCSLWYTVVEGDTCARVSLAQSISLTDLCFLNPEIDENCSNLLLGKAYCVSPVGFITRYQNYTITGVLPTSATFSSVNTDIPTSTSDPGFNLHPAPAPPAAPGTLSDCYKYYATSFEDEPCSFLASSYQVSFEDLVLWNPSLENNQANCTLSTEYSYCAKLYENSTNYTCDDILDSYDITLSQLLAWNTWLAEGDCNTALFANLGDLEDRSVCVGVDSTSVTPTPISTGSTTTTTSMGPSQTGIASDCNAYHNVVSGDSCAAIEETYEITFAKLYQWNPAVGSDCELLQIGYSLCVGVAS